MTPLRLRAVWLTLGWLLTAGIVILSLLPMPEIPAPDIPFQDKWGHVLAYGLLMAWFCQLYLELPQRLALLAGFGLLGAALELAQALGGSRFGDWQDLAADLLGLLLGWALGARLGQRLLRALESRIPF